MQILSQENSIRTAFFSHQLLFWAKWNAVFPNKAFQTNLNEKSSRNTALSARFCTLIM